MRSALTDAVSIDDFDAAQQLRRRRLRILVLARGFPPAIGGVERYNWELCRELAACGHAVHVLRLDPGDPPDVAGTGFALVGERPASAGEAIGAVERAIAALAPDAVLVSRFSRNLARVMGLLRRHRTPTFVFAHGLRRRDIDAGRAKRWRRRRAYGFANARSVFANSEHTRRRLLRLGVPGGRLEIAYPGIARGLARSEGARQGLRSRFGLENKRVLLTLARLEPEKRIDAVIRVLPSVLARVPDAHYLVVGDGGERKRLETLARPLAAHVTFVGAQRDVAPWYSAADVYVHLPRRGTSGGYAGESFGMACAEASACGLPVVASCVGGLREVVKHGVTGMLVDPDNDRQTVNSLSLLLESAAKRSELGANGLRYVERFSWERCARVVDVQLQRVGAEAAARVDARRAGAHASADGSSNQEDSR